MNWMLKTVPIQNLKQLRMLFRIGLQKTVDTKTNYMGLRAVPLEPLTHSVILQHRDELCR